MVPDASSAQSPDDPFAVVAGLYVGITAAPLAVLASGFRTAGAVYLSLLAGIGLLTAVVAVVLRRRPALAVSLGADGRRFLPAALPLAIVALGAVASTVAFGRRIFEDAVLLLLVSVLGSLVLGSVLAVMADTRYATAATADAETAATWRAPWPDRHRRAARYAGGTLVVASALAFLVGAVWNRSLVRYAGQVLLPMGVVVAVSVGQHRTYHATSAGLVFEAPVRKHLRRWNAFDGYALTDEAVVLHPTAPWRLPVYCAREALDDEETVVTALGAHLPRLPADV